MAWMIRLIEEQYYIDLTPIMQLVEQLALEPEYDDSDQSIVVDPNDMEMEETHMRLAL